jgi:hypothetical protein
LNDEIKKINLIKKTRLLLKKLNLTKTEKKTQGNPCYFIKKDKSHRKRIKTMLDDEIAKKKSLKKKKKTKQTRVNLVNSG